MELNQCLLLEDKRFQILDELRHLPGKRWVGRISRNGQSFIAKLFYGPKKERDARREIEGHTYLQKAGLNCPQLLQISRSRSGHPVLIFEFIQGKTLAQLDHPPWPLLIDDFFKLHRAGIWGKDPHWHNFLFSDRIYWLDGGDFYAAQSPLPLKKVLDHLGLFLAQGSGAWSADLFQSYTQYYGADFTLRLKKAVQSARYRRAKKIAQKSMRNCTEFKTYVQSHYRIWQRRELASEPLIDWIQSGMMPENRIKSGRSQTVWRMLLWHRSVIVKRYNIKSFWHHLKRQLHPRAQKAWQNAHRLRAYGLPTPLPLALIQSYHWGKNTAWLLTEQAPGYTVADYFQHCSADSEPCQPAWQLVQKLAEYRIIHGDLKSSNLIFDPDTQQVQLIDLDAMRFPRFGGQKAILKDQSRWRRNWSNQNEPIIQ